MVNLLSPARRKLILPTFWIVTAGLFLDIVVTQIPPVFSGKRFRIHNHRVKSIVSRDKLLVYNLQRMETAL